MWSMRTPNSECDTPTAMTMAKRMVSTPHRPTWRDGAARSARLCGEWEQSTCGLLYSIGVYASTPPGWRSAIR